MSEFIVKITDLDASGKDYDFVLAPSWVGVALEGSDLRGDPGAGEGTLSIHAQKMGQDVLVQGHLRVRLVTDCVRCLEDAPVDVDVDLTTLFSARGTAPRHEGEAEADADEPDREYYSGDEIALDDLVREHMLLECPMQPLCSDDCEGIEVPSHVRPPADFGAEGGEDAIDPRLAPLKEIARDIGHDEE